MELKERILQLAEANFEKVVNIRRHLHAHPELSFEEQQTAEFIKRELDFLFTLIKMSSPYLHAFSHKLKMIRNR